MLGITHQIGNNGLVAICASCETLDPDLEAIPGALDYRGVHRGLSEISTCEHPGHGHTVDDWTTCTAVQTDCDQDPSNDVGLCRFHSRSVLHA